ncbi:IDEAL domain-containing protein [Marinococcus luteus]|uniref:IDEAL domain-containing protein n=1 Tax=Marinococcus luteus TaxID=1122204 RepID=UPI002ACC5306|nr:IDEAL domain-containing protein [Marinococcus luteus]MDZ5783690.1 IDEAL domain-containing protein [Marinococcus luteus]
MLHPTHEQHFMKKVKPIQNGRRPSRQILQSLYAQMMMEYAVFEFNRERLLQKIDDSLDMHDEKAFQEWTEAYKELMSEYKDGKVLFEQGYKLELEFE